MNRRSTFALFIAAIGLLAVACARAVPEAAELTALPPDDVRPSAPRAENLFETVELRLRDGLPAEIPIEIGAAITLPAWVRGTPGQHAMMFDTGAPNVLAPELMPEAPYVRRYGQTPLTNARGHRVDGLGLHVLAGLAVGPDAQFRFVTTYDAWPARPHPLRCISDSGIVGHSVVRRGAWQLDFVDHVLRVAETVDQHVLDDARRFPIQTGAAGMTLRVRIGDHDIDASIDTGYLGGLSVPSEVFDALFEPREVEVRETLTVVAFEEPIRETLRTAPADVMLGGEGGVSIRVDLSPSDHRPLLLGLDALRQLTAITFDWQNGAVYLHPGEPAPPPTYRTVQPIWSEERVVVGVATEPARAAGVQEGDVILRADELDLTRPTFEDYCGVLMRRPRPRRFELLRDGEQVHVTLPGPT